MKLSRKTRKQIKNAKRFALYVILAAIALMVLAHISLTVSLVIVAVVTCVIFEVTKSVKQSSRKRASARRRNQPHVNPSKAKSS